ncbi:glutaredoxin family protein [Dyella tabacisoli]|uniref:Glutaredoxin family protein n=1 Tax=Dyella tabacisoli TaxID=2282381 RepID=A0A369ULZ1_9GAMM|nr:glutaredoxin family protein [Dyella tabacisoli]RDD81772.1 glutaredoxin family protein [Dyella tabacisoli]
MRLKSLLFMAVFLVVGVAAGVGVGRYVIPLVRPAAALPQLVSSGDYREQYIKPAGKPVVLFSLSTCPHCRDTRAYFAAHGIVYTDYVIDESEDARIKFETLNEPGVPVVLTTGHKVRGYHPQAYADVFKQDGVAERLGGASDLKGP